MIGDRYEVTMKNGKVRGRERENADRQWRERNTTKMREKEKRNRIQTEERKKKGNNNTCYVKKTCFFIQFAFWLVFNIPN